MSKYRNKKTQMDGIVFDSKKEAYRYVELRLLEGAGKITSLVLQRKFVFPLKYDSGRKITYRADFSYFEDGLEVIEDVKGMKTMVYKMKKAMMKYFHNIEVRET